MTVVLQDSTGSWMPGESGAQRTAEGVELNTKLFTDVDLVFVRPQ